MPNNTSIYINGKFADASNATVSLFDYGVLYGDGVFEGIRIYSGQAFKLPDHLKRLIQSCHAVRINLSLSAADLTDIVYETCRANNIDDGYLRLMITRGIGSLGLNPASCGTPTVICMPSPIALYPPEAYEHGLRLFTAPTRRSPQDAFGPRVKSLNYLPNIVAKLEAQHCGFDEALMLNEAGDVAECTSDNIFIVRNGTVMTPDVSSGILGGITRAAIQEICHSTSRGWWEGRLQRFDIYNADECFLTGTAVEIVPVVELDGVKIGQGKPGLVTKDLSSNFKRLVRATEMEGISGR